MIRGAIKIAVLAVLVYVVIDSLFKLGVNLHYKKHHPGECRQVKGLDFGSEDFQVTKDGLAFITSGISYTAMSSSYKAFLQANNIRGRIFFFDFNKPDAGAKELKIQPTKNFNPQTFRPHGISLLEDGVKGEHILYVINHPDPEADRVEKFRFLPKTNELVHLKSFSSDKLMITNDLAVTEEDKFYIGNYLYFNNHHLSTLIEQGLFPITFGSLLFFNGSDFTEMASGLYSPNGLTLSKDKRYLYMNLPLTASMNVYERNVADNSVTLVQTVPLHTCADNFHLSQSGEALYTGTHPITYKVMQHLGDPNNRAPSSVLRIPLKNGKVVPEDITELFYDHGDLISASTVAVTYNNKLLIGSIIDKLVLCGGKLEL